MFVFIRKIYLDCRSVAFNIQFGEHIHGLQLSVSVSSTFQRRIRARHVPDTCRTRFGPCREQTRCVFGLDTDSTWIGRDTDTGGRTRHGRNLITRPDNHKNPNSPIQSSQNFLSPLSLPSAKRKLIVVISWW